jgi:hypothetical protein
VLGVALTLALACPRLCAQPAADVDARTPDADRGGADAGGTVVPAGQAPADPGGVSLRAYRERHGLDAGDAVAPPPGYQLNRLHRVDPARADDDG